MNTFKKHILLKDFILMVFAQLLKLPDITSNGKFYCNETKENCFAILLSFVSNIASISIEIKFFKTKMYEYKYLNRFNISNKKLVCLRQAVLIIMSYSLIWLCLNEY